MSTSLLMFSPALPVAEPDNAGTRYVRDVLRALPSDLEPTVVVPDGPAVQRARTQGPTVNHRILPHPPEARTRIGGRLRGLWDGAPRSPREFAWHLDHSPDLQRAVATADVIDLQWIEQAELIRRLRQINPDARIITTVHDVLSQRFGRQAAASTDPARRLRWRWAVQRSRRVEQRMMDESDTVVVLSDKDRRLLPPGRAEVVSIVPPLAGSPRRPKRTPDEATVLFVGYLARWENEEGLVWFLTDVLPRVRARRPEARMIIAGDGLRDSVRRAAEQADADLLGFVEDLEPLYRTATVSVIPLNLGAGVKFKTVDALAAGVPVVATPVGAEGIGERRADRGEGLFQAVTEDPAAFAQAVLEAMDHPEAASIRAVESQEWVRIEYGQDQFRDTIQAIYG